MAFESYPNTAHNARALTLAEHEKLVYPLGQTGLVGGVGSPPVIADSSGRQVKLKAGVGALIRGTRFTNLTETVVSIPANTSGNTRIDLLVLRLNRATYEITPVPISGSPGGSPVAPPPVRNEPGGSPDYYDLPLAEITVTNGATTISAGQVAIRGYWIFGSGLVGNSDARPPVETGLIWAEIDTGIKWVGAAGGVFQRIYDHTPYDSLGSPGGWNTSNFHFGRDGNIVTGTIRIERTGAALSASTSAVFGNLGPSLRPARDFWGTYTASKPMRGGFLFIGTDGAITFSRDFVNSIDTGAQLTANPTYLAAP